MGFGLAITKAIDIQNLYHLIPVFLVLSSIQAVSTHVSTKIVDEIYLHNGRANLLFESYFSSSPRTFRTCKDINSIDNFYLPNFMNFQRCHFIQYGKNNIASILTSDDYSESMIHQLDKLEKSNRKFVYYLKNETSVLFNKDFPL